MKRRNFLHGLLAALPVSLVGSQLARAGEAHASAPATPAVQRDAGRALAIASGNGLKAVEIAYNKLVAGEDPVDAAIAGVNTQELDPKDMSVGYGGLPNFDGVVQLDSAVMHGPSGKGGAVASLEGVKTPSKVAKLVMDRTDHVLIVGEGARRFATMHGFANENLLTDAARRRWVRFRERLSERDDWVAPPESPDGQARIRKIFEEEFADVLTDGDVHVDYYGTIHLSALTPAGDIGCCTTTSGLSWKIPGRVGDSPLIGCGLYCDNDIGSAGCTGRGEAAILSNAAHTAVEIMRQGRAPKDALIETLKRIVHLTRDKTLLDGDGRPNFYMRMYALNKVGEYGSADIWSGGRFTVCDARGPRREDIAHLFEGKPNRG